MGTSSWGFLDPRFLAQPTTPQVQVARMVLSAQWLRWAWACSSSRTVQVFVKAPWYWRATRKRTSPQFHCCVPTVQRTKTDYWRNQDSRELVQGASGHRQPLPCPPPERAGSAGNCLSGTVTFSLQMCTNKLKSAQTTAKAGQRSAAEPLRSGCPPWHHTTRGSRLSWTLT